MDSSDIKRVLLALVLSVAIMWIWTAFFSPTHNKQAQEAAQTQKAAQTPAAQGAAQPAPGSPVAAVPAQTGGETVPMADVVVDTPLYTATFSERGASLKRMVLKKYTNLPDGQGGEYVMIDIPNTAPYTLGASLPGQVNELENAKFQASTQKLLVNGGQNQVVFQTVAGPFSVKKTYTFQPDSYAFRLSFEILNGQGQAVEIHPELQLTQLSAKEHANQYAFAGMQIYKDGSLEEYTPSDMEDATVAAGKLEWANLAIPYFMGAAVPDTKGTEDVKRSVRPSYADGVMKAVLVEPPVTIQPGQAAGVDYIVYYGPKDLEVLEPLGRNLAASVDFGWFDIIAKPMLAALIFLEKYIGNYGVAILIVTLLIKLLFWPLTKKSYQSMKQMQKLQPQIQKLREKYKDDKQKMNQEMMQLYKTYKVNPMGGCLPMVVQIPVFIAFYKVLGGSIELWHAPFMLWINDLSAPDRLPIGFDIPYVGAGLPVLTLLMGASMFIQQKMTPMTTGDPTQQKMMLLMPVIFTVFFINFPSGLVLYWLFNNLFSIGQQTLTNRSKA